MGRFWGDWRSRRKGRSVLVFSFVFLDTEVETVASCWPDFSGVAPEVRGSSKVRCRVCVLRVVMRSSHSIRVTLVSVERSSVGSGGVNTGYDKGESDDVIDGERARGRHRLERESQERSLKIKYLVMLVFQ